MFDRIKALLQGDGTENREPLDDEGELRQATAMLLAEAATISATTGKHIDLPIEAKPWEATPQEPAVTATP